MPDDLANALPGEVNGVPRGPMHRAGQPCLLCHSSLGSATPNFSLAGTVYQKRSNDIALENAIVHVEDARGGTRDLQVNCAGNF